MNDRKRFVTGLWRADRGLTATGFAMLGILAFTGIGLVVDPRTITGAPAWLKPAKFAASIAIYVFTLAWLFSYLPEWVRTRRLVGRITVIAMWLEMALISLQASRGTTSHFNVATLLDGAVFATMGITIVLQTLASVLVAAAIWRQRFADPALGWAFRLGLSITILGASTGGLMTRPTEAQMEAVARGGRMTISGAHTVGAPDGGPGIPGTGFSVTHGDLRVPHFFGLHAIQILPLLALGLRRLRIADKARVRLVLAGGASYGGLFAILLAQALHGKPLVHPDESTLGALAVWAAVSLALFFTAWFPGGARKGYVTS